jgi:hypothetical protein
LIERQTTEIRRLSESATMWQIRAIQAEEKLKMLTAGETAEDDADDQPQLRTAPPTAPPDGPGSTETPKTRYLARIAAVVAAVWG